LTDRKPIRGYRRPVADLYARSAAWLPAKVKLMTDELDQDIQVLSAWLKDAWLYLAQNPNLTAFDRQEFRNSMKQAQSTLSLAIRQAAAREKARRESATLSTTGALKPDFRILSLTG
jgi:hypothetical protein